VSQQGTHMTYLWWSGERVLWDEAKVHVTGIGWPALSAVFEGVRAYKSRDGQATYLFRYDAHLDRLWRSMRFMQLHSRWSKEELIAATVELIRANGVIDDLYVQPMAYAMGANRGLMAMATQPADIYITTRVVPSHLPDPKPETVMVSSWTRIHDNILPPRVKAVVNYLNSRFAQSEASRGGYDRALFLNSQGKVAEGGAECFFLVRDGVVVTPPTTAGILESITRQSVIELCRNELKVPVVERDIDRTETYFADEMFFVGTMHEIAPIRSVDGFEVPEGGAGPVTKSLMALFERVVRGDVPQYRHWLTRVALD
jgi:branched-chain amino acid aminotransferase